MKSTRQLLLAEISSVQPVTPEPKPFVKWAGGKRKLVGEFLKHFPSKFNRYFEPFIGGGAVLFELLRRNPKLDATILDINHELINCYEVIRDNVEELIHKLKVFEQNHSKEHYYEIRAWDRDSDYFKKINSIERASRLIYLNKTCYNGLYRVNKSGQFNVPMGRYKKPLICDEENLIAVSAAIQDIKIREGTFEMVQNLAKKGDFIYFDPPYQPLSTTSSFTSYTKGDFDEQAQERLYRVFHNLDKNGCYVALSNSSAPFIRKLYINYNLTEIQATRAINSVASKRGKIPELLITNS